MQKVKPVDPGSGEAARIERDFKRNVNMTATTLRAWLTTDESKSVGQKSDGRESVGHDSGRRIAAILDKRTGARDADDFAHMKKVNGYVARHLTQRPDQSRHELEHARSTYSLKNWGHDPLK